MEGRLVGGRGWKGLFRGTAEWIGAWSAGICERITMFCGGEEALFGGSRGLSGRFYNRLYFVEVNKLNPTPQFSFRD